MSPWAGGIDGAILFYCHDAVAGHIIPVNGAVFYAHSQRRRLACGIVEGAAVYAYDPAVGSNCALGSLPGASVGSVRESGFQLGSAFCFYMGDPVVYAVDGFSAKLYAQGSAIICIIIIALGNHRLVRALLIRAPSVAVHIIVSHPGIFSHDAGGGVKVIVILADLYPAGGHGGIGTEIIAIAVVIQPLAGNRHPIFIKIVLIVGAGGPAGCGT